ncbi:MAG: DUF4097 family beta strand repeat-containing protein [Thermoanaerobaculia bacterium]
MRFVKMLIVSGAFLGMPLASTASDCPRSEPRDATLDAAGATTLRVEAEAGILMIRGTSGLTEVRVQGKACAPDKDVLDEIELRTDRRGNTLYIEVEIPDGNWRRNSPYLDLEIEVPEYILLDVEDGSGSVKIEGVRGLELEDGSGDILVHNIAEDIEIVDGSGELKVTDVGGRIRLNDGSGSLEIEHVGGPVSIEDGSGEITVRDTEAGVEIVEDGSGSIELDHIGGDVLVQEDGSGSIRAEHVAGDFIVERDGSGGVTFNHIEGDIKVP